LKPVGLEPAGAAILGPQPVQPDANIAVPAAAAVVTHDG